MKGPNKNIQTLKKQREKKNKLKWEKLLVVEGHKKVVKNIIR